MTCDNRPIGVFDSGLGGLTAVTHLAKLLPGERFVYFGDTARTPYGSKAVETIQKFSVEIVEFLLKQEAKMIVIACNTVTATCLDLLRERFPGVPVIGIIEPAARKVGQEYGNRRVGIIGTKVTIESGQYERSIRAYEPECRVFSRACPLFVPAIEEGLEAAPLMEQIVRHYLDDFVTEYALEALVLGCTHYPLVEPILHRLYPALAILNPSEIVAREVQEVLERQGLRAEDSERENRFYASDLSDSFVRMARGILPSRKAEIRFKNFEELSCAE